MVCKNIYALCDAGKKNALCSACALRAVKSLKRVKFILNISRVRMNNASDTLRRLSAKNITTIFLFLNEMQ